MRKDANGWKSFLGDLKSENKLYRQLKTPEMAFNPNPAIAEFARRADEKLRFCRG